MKLSLLILGLTSLLIKALPIAEPGKTACYAQEINGVSQEVCTGASWVPPNPTTENPPTNTTTTATTQAQRRAAEPARTACYAQKVNGVDTEVCTGPGWVSPTDVDDTSSTTTSAPDGVIVSDNDD